MPSVINVKNRLTTQMRKYTPAEPVNSGRMTRSPAPAGAAPDLAAGAAPPLFNDSPRFRKFDPPDNQFILPLAPRLVDKPLDRRLVLQDAARVDVDLGIDQHAGHETQCKKGQQPLSLYQSVRTTWIGSARLSIFALPAMSDFGSVRRAADY